MLVRCTVNNNSDLNMKMKDFTHLLSLGLSSTLCEEIKEVLDLKGTGSLQSGGACRADLCKGQAGSSSFKQFPCTGLSWGKAKSLCTTD